MARDRKRSMKTHLQAHTRRIRESRDALLDHYDPANLHDLRVAIRHLRSLLKPVPGAAAVGLRKRWARLASATNAARDWDVLGDDLADRLDPVAMTTLRPYLRHRCDAARAAALRTLSSGQWRKTAASWDRYLSKPNSQLDHAPVVRPPDKAEQRLAKAARKAVRSERTADWHKLRIAAKDLRYTLEAHVDAGEDQDTLMQRISWCTALQDALGEWHDCEVQSGLLSRLREDTQAAGAAEASGYIDDVLALVSGRRENCLQRAASLIRGSGLQLQPQPGPAV